MRVRIPPSGTSSRVASRVVEAGVDGNYSFAYPVREVAFAISDRPAKRPGLLYCEFLKPTVDEAEDERRDKHGLE